MRKTVSLLLALLMALNLAACIRVPAWQTVQAAPAEAATATPATATHPPNSFVGLVLRWRFSAFRGA